MSNDDLTVEHVWRGGFWLPDKPDACQQGVLEYTPDNGVTLRFVGGFDDRQRVATSPSGYVATKGSGRFSLIHGAVGNDKPVTLMDSRVTHYQTAGWMDHVREQDISVSRLLTGLNLKHAEARIFSEIAVELENLTEWHRHGGVTIFFDHSEDSPRRQNWRIQVEPQERLAIDAGEITG